MKALLIVGTGPCLASACALAARLDRTYRSVELVSLDGFSFDWRSALEGISPSDVELFVALDGRAVNSARALLLDALCGAGFAFARLIAPDAYVAESVSLGDNVYIGSGCRLLESVEVARGAWLDAGLLVESEACIGAFATLGVGVVVQQSARIGQRSTLSSGSCVPAAGTVGEQSEWLLGGRVPAVLVDRSFHDDMLPEGATIFRWKRQSV